MSMQRGINGNVFILQWQHEAVMQCSMHVMLCVAIAAIASIVDLHGCELECTDLRGKGGSCTEQ